MMQMLSFAVLLLAFGQLSNAQVPFPDNCPEVKTMKDFSLDAYTGIWYEYSKYPFRFEVDRKCNYAKYGNLGNNTMSVMNSGINTNTFEQSSTNGYGKVVGPGKFALVFRPGQSETEANYIVLGTDYISYAVVYSCTNYSGAFNNRSVWILARDRKPNPLAVAAAKKIMDQNNLTQKYLIETKQDKCPNVA